MEVLWRKGANFNFKLFFFIGFLHEKKSVSQPFKIEEMICSSIAE